MQSFLSNVASAGLGFLAMKFATAWLDAKVTHSSYIEQERNQDLKRIIEGVDLLSDQATLYWSRDYEADDEQLKQQIVPKMHDVANLCHDLFELRNASFRAVRSELDRFEDLITGGSFGEKTKTAKPQQIISLRKQGTDLQRAVRKQRKKLPPVWWPFQT